MTMHLAHPALTLSGKRRGKHKFRNADEARKARELQESWENLKAKWAPTTPVRKNTTPTISTLQPKVYRRDTGPKYPSLNNGVDSCAATKAPDKVYTGTKILGIGTMHKSNAVPIFSDEEAQDISRMRRG